MTQKQKILWIDDEFVDELHGLMSYVYELESKDGGFEVVKIAHPDEALVRLENQKEDFVCIVLDIMLPHGESISGAKAKAGNLTGTIVKEKIHAMEQYRGIPIVVLTGVRRSGLIATQYSEKNWHYKADVSAEGFREIIKKEVEKAKNER